MRSSLIITGTAVSIAAAAAVWVALPADPLTSTRSLAGAVSEMMCEGVFVSGLSPEQAYRDMLLPLDGVRSFGWAARFEVDPAGRQVTTRVLGVVERRSIFREGSGCLLLQGPAPDTRSADVADKPVTPLLPEIAGPAVVEPSDERLREALDHAFAEPEAPPYRRTHAVVVVHDGQIIAERYAAGYGIDTRLRGNSDTKAVVNALLGILVRDGRLAMAAPAPVSDWQQIGDERRAITPEQLLRMTSGLAWEEALGGAGGIDSVSRMQLLERDMTAFAESMPLAAAPGTRWQYDSGNTMILSRIIRDAVGGHQEEVQRFARRELFDPLGMHEVTLLFDATGTPVGGSGMLATARDWARFGLLYLDDGVVGGRRLLPEGWVAWSAAPTSDASIGYGAGFWTNRGTSPGAERRIRQGMPADAFYASGMFGQYVVAVPSRHLVVARFGMSTGPYADTPGVSRLVGELVAAIDEGAVRAEAGR
jgi:CubicO group peptidase (beta-lactamase class C family)